MGYLHSTMGNIEIRHRFAFWAKFLHDFGTNHGSSRRPVHGNNKLIHTFWYEYKKHIFISPYIYGCTALSIPRPCYWFFHGFLLTCFRQKVSLCAHELLVASGAGWLRAPSPYVLADCFGQRRLRRVYLVFAIWAHYTSPELWGLDVRTKSKRSVGVLHAGI